MNTVVVGCQACEARYRIDEAKIQKNVNAQYRCKRCGKLFKAKPLTVAQLEKTKKNQTNPPEKPKVKQANAGKESNSDTVFTVSAPTESAQEFNIELGDTDLKKSGFFGRFSLRTKFNMALVSIMALSTAATFYYSDSRLHLQAERNVASQGRLLLDTLEASRSFTSKVIKPALYKAVPGQFIVEGMSSSFGARNIFERLNKKYPDFYFKHASSNPRNLVNIADKFEMSIINDKFKPNPDLEEWQGYRDLNGVKDFVIMKPIVAKDRCLKCHSTPERAPVEIIERYGPKTGFGMVVGDVIAALTISVPATKIFNAARQNSIIFTAIVFVCFILLGIVINVFFQTIVIKPINRLADNVQQISVGNSNIKIDTSGNDEISELAKGFDRMNTSIQLAMSRLRK